MSSLLRVFKHSNEVVLHLNPERVPRWPGAVLRVDALITVRYKAAPPKCPLEQAVLLDVSSFQTAAMDVAAPS